MPTIKVPLAFDRIIFALSYALLSVVFLSEQDKSKVGLICGGGSGHEPSHAGFVGKIIDRLSQLWVFDIHFGVPDKAMAC
jgi:hypothetical protein